MNDKKPEPDLVSGFRKALKEAGYVNLTPGGHTIEGPTVHVDTYEETGIPIDSIALKIMNERIERLEHALITLASWVQTGEWAGAQEYIKALLRVKDEV